METRGGNSGTRAIDLARHPRTLRDDETDSGRTIELEVPDWPGVPVRAASGRRLTAERSYSIATAGGKPVAITVERLDDGEVSPYLAGEPRAGDEVELRGPIGRWFVWDTSDSGPLLLVAGGSGAAGPVAETVVYLRGPTSAA